MNKTAKTLIIILAVLLLGAGLYDAVHKGHPDTPFDVVLKVALGMTGAALGWNLIHAIKHNED